MSDIYISEGIDFMNQTTPHPVATPPVPQPAVPTGGKKMNKGLLAGIIAAIVLVLAGGAWIAYAIFSAPTPESLVKDALKNLSNEKSFAIDFAVSGDGASLAGSFAAMSDDTDKNGEVILSLGEDGQGIGLRLLTVDGDFFVKVANIEQIAPLLGVYMGDMEAVTSPEFIATLQSLNDIWFEITKEEFESLTETTEASAANTVTMSQQDIKQVLDLYDKHPFVKADKVFADEAVNGVKSAHFSVKIDKQQEAAFLDALKNANIESIKLTDEQIADFKKATAEQTAVIELWIARDTKKLTKVLINGEAEGQQVAITLTRSANPPVFDKLERPAESTPIAELMSLLLGTSLPADEMFDTTNLLQ